MKQQKQRQIVKLVVAGNKKACKKYFSNPSFREWDWYVVNKANNKKVVTLAITKLRHNDILSHRLIYLTKFAKSKYAANLAFSILEKYHYSEAFASIVLDTKYRSVLKRVAVRYLETLRSQTKLARYLLSSYRYSVRFWNEYGDAINDISTTAMAKATVRLLSTYDLSDIVANSTNSIIVDIAAVEFFTHRKYNDENLSRVAAGKHKVYSDMALERLQYIISEEVRYSLRKGATYLNVSDGVINGIIGIGA